jgi:hypothetical protein
MGRAGAFAATLSNPYGAGQISLTMIGADERGRRVPPFGATYLTVPFVVWNDSAGAFATLFGTNARSTTGETALALRCDLRP